MSAEEGDKKAAKPAMIEVYRLLQKNEITKDLVNAELYILWPDTSTWYEATVTKVSCPSSIPLSMLVLNHLHYLSQAHWHACSDSRVHRLLAVSFPPVCFCLCSVDNPMPCKILSHF